MIPFLKKWLSEKPSRESEIRAEIAILDRVVKYGGNITEDGWAYKKALVEELAAIRAGSGEKGK